MAAVITGMVISTDPGDEALRCRFNSLGKRIDTAKHNLEWGVTSDGGTGPLTCGAPLALCRGTMPLRLGRLTTWNRPSPLDENRSDTECHSIDKRECVTRFQESRS